MNLHILQYVEYVNLIYIMNIINQSFYFRLILNAVTMKTGGFSCGKESLLQEVIHSEKLNGAFRRQRGGASVGRRGALRRQKRSFP